MEVIVQTFQSWSTWSQVWTVIYVIISLGVGLISGLFYYSLSLKGAPKRIHWESDNLIYQVSLRNKIMYGITSSIIVMVMPFIFWLILVITIISAVVIYISKDDE